MELIGMLDSPYVRRAAVALQAAGVRFAHRPISLFRQIDEFSQINPLLKAPTFVADDGTVLMDSSVVLAYLASIAPAVAALTPSAPAARLASARATGVALTVMEKAAQRHYERAPRPPEKRHEPWIAPVERQLAAGLEALERESPSSGWIGGAGLGVADISVVCAFGFTQLLLADLVDKARHPRLAAFCARGEELPAFCAAPALDGATAPVATAH